MAIKTVYTVVRPFFLVASNGDHKEIPVGTVLKAREYAALTPQKKEKVSVTEVESTRAAGGRRGPVDDSPEGLARRERRRQRRAARKARAAAAAAVLQAVQAEV